MRPTTALTTCLALIASADAFYSTSIRSANPSRCLAMKAERISVMVNGMPGPMAVEVAKACLDRGFNLLPLGFTGAGQPDHVTVTGAKTFVDVELVAGPGVSENAGKALSILKEMHPNLVIVDYTHPSAILNNLACYVENNCDFVMGTTGGDAVKMMEIFDKGTNKAVIAPNMAKQIVALQAALQEMSARFPKSFADYKLTVCIKWNTNVICYSFFFILGWECAKDVAFRFCIFLFLRYSEYLLSPECMHEWLIVLQVTESHQSSKADTSGTAKVRH
jgi:Dihydrodipicolinate reductase, N-terminus